MLRFRKNQLLKNLYALIVCHIHAHYQPTANSLVWFDKLIIVHFHLNPHYHLTVNYCFESLLVKMYLGTFFFILATLLLLFIAMIQMIH